MNMALASPTHEPDSDERGSVLDMVQSYGSQVFIGIGRGPVRGAGPESPTEKLARHASGSRSLRIGGNRSDECDPIQA